LPVPSSAPFFFPDTPTPQTYPLSLHDALPISAGTPDTRCASAASASRCASPQSRDWSSASWTRSVAERSTARRAAHTANTNGNRSEEHTSELQSRGHLVCRLLLEKKKKTKQIK